MWDEASHLREAELGCWPCTCRSSPSMVPPLAPPCFLPKLSSQLQTFAIKECSQWFQGMHAWLPCGPARSGITCINVGWLFFFCDWQLFFIAADLPGSDGMLALNSTRHSSTSVACEADAYKHWIVCWGWDSTAFIRSLFYHVFQIPPRMIKDYFLFMLTYFHSSVCPQLRCCFHLVEISFIQD